MSQTKMTRKTLGVETRLVNEYSMKDSRYKIILACILAITCIYLTLLLEPAYFQTNKGYNKGLFDVMEGDSFTIVQFTDLHFGEHAESDTKSKQVMKNVLEKEPLTDLVVFSGDQVSGYVLDDSREVLIKWLESLETPASLWIPFAAIFGNHDDQPFVTVPLPCYIWVKFLGLINMAILVVMSLVPEYRKYTWIPWMICVALAWMFFVGYPSTIMRRSMLHYELAFFSEFSQSREGPSDIHGLSNYFLRVAHENQTVLIFLLDTGGGRLGEIYTDSQLRWVKSVSDRHPGADAIAFAHIPSSEFHLALQDEVNFQCFGHEHTEPDEVAEWEHEPPMKSLANAGVKAVFVGHNHRNSYCCVPRQNDDLMPTMCYGRHTGYGGYGDWARGARVVRLMFEDQKLSIWTWLRMENGSKILPRKIYPFH